MAPPKSKAAKRKNRSSDVSSNFTDNSVEGTTHHNNKKHRSLSTNSRQSTLTDFVDPKNMASTGQSDRTFTAGVGEDCNEPQQRSSLLEQLSVIQTQLKDKFEALDKKIVSSQEKLSDQISNRFDKLESEIFSLAQENDQLKAKLEDAEDTIEDLQEEVKTLKTMLDKEKEHRNELEQYQRRDCVRFLGVGPDQGQESTEECESKILAIINNDLGLGHIHPSDISIAHRVGVRSNNKIRPIIVKFISRKHKVQVIKKRRLLKGSHRGITEDLTSLNMTRLNSVQQHPNVKNSWTTEGKIHALLKNNKVVKVTAGNMNLLEDQTTKVQDIEMSEVLSSPTTSGQTGSAQVAVPVASTPKQYPLSQRRSRRDVDRQESSERAAS